MERQRHNGYFGVTYDVDSQRWRGLVWKGELVNGVMKYPIIKRFYGRSARQVAEMRDLWLLENWQGPCRPKLNFEWEWREDAATQPWGELC